MKRYRYRTRALVGAWRSTLEQAEEDAVARRQAERGEAPRHALRWRVAGFIEAEE